jgi:ankyrin repeat protein
MWDHVRALNRERGLPTAELTALLLLHGADPNAESKDGSTPIVLANRYRHTQAIELLKRYGAWQAHGLGRVDDERSSHLKTVGCDTRHPTVGLRF